LTLANGQEKNPASTENFVDADFKNGVQFVFNHIFSYAQLKNSKFVGMRNYAKLLKDIYDEHGSIKNIGGPGTYEDAFWLYYRRLGIKELALSDKTFPLTLTKTAVALMAFRSCHYEIGDEYFKKVMEKLRHAGKDDTLGCEWCSREMPDLIYYAGYSIHQEGNPADPYNVYLNTDYGIKCKARTLENFGSGIKILLDLSKERDQLPWLKNTDS